MHQLRKRLALAGGLAIVAAALAPPLSHMAQILFAAHMGQHLLLVAGAAPLLAAAGVRVGFRPVWAWLLFVCVFLMWHWPTAFQWAALHPPMGLVELGSILLAALGFWNAAFRSRELSDGGRALMVMTAAVATDLPGVVMLFAPTAICVMPHENAALFGLSPLSDQEIAGVLMWVPANLVFFGIATFLFARWMSPQSFSSTPLVNS